MLKALIKLSLSVSVLLILGLSCSKDSTNPQEEEEHHFEAVGLMLRQNGVDIVSYENGVVTGQIEVEAGLTTTLISVRFIDEDGDEGVPDDDDISLGLNIEDENIAGLVQHQGEEWSFHVEGRAQGETNLTVSILHGDHADFESAPIPIHVTEGGAHGEPVGLVLIGEVSGDTLVTVDSGTVSGIITVMEEQESEHIVTKYFDDAGNYFQPDPAEHSQEYTVVDTTIAEVSSHGGETYELEVAGKTVGSTAFVILLKHAGSPEFETPEIPITVTQ